MALNAVEWDLRVKDVFLKWLEQQKFDSWRVVTLKYPNTGDKSVWIKACELTFIELENTFLRGSLLTMNRANGAGDHLRRIVVFGGNKSAGEKIHVHCLVDGIGDDGKFQHLLNKAWKHSIKKAVRSSKGNDKFIFEESAQVYVKKTEGSCDRYGDYMMRPEGFDFKFGVDKVIFEALYLS